LPRTEILGSNSTINSNDKNKFPLSKSRHNEKSGTPLKGGIRVFSFALGFLPVQQVQTGSIEPKNREQLFRKPNEKHFKTPKKGQKSS